MNVTPEVIEALAWLRKGWDGDNSERAITCLDILDNAGIFAAIDEVTGYDVNPEQVSKCTCDELDDRNGAHHHGCPGDPAEWGDMAFTRRP